MTFAAFAATSRAILMDVMQRVNQSRKFRCGRCIKHIPYPLVHICKEVMALKVVAKIASVKPIYTCDLLLFMDVIESISHNCPGEETYSQNIRY